MSFNQAASCFAFAARIPETTSSVIRVFNSDPLSEKLRLSSSVVVLWQRPLVESQPINHGPSAAANPSNPSFLVYELLHRSNFIALVIASNPNSVVIWDCLKGRIVLEYREESRVLGVNWRCDRIIITLLTRVKVYTFSPSPVHLYTFATMTNDYALTSLSPVTSQTTNSVVLAFCGRNTGQVQYCTLTTGTLRPNHQPPSLSIIQAHNNPLRSITVSKSGKYIATASSTGTLIRVFDSATRSVLHEFRRGTENALIYCLKFCWDERFLIVGSDRGTAHIFIVGSPPPLATESSTEMKRANSSFSPSHPATTALRRRKDHLYQSHHKQNGGFPASPASAPPSLSLPQNNTFNKHSNKGTSAAAAANSTSSSSTPFSSSAITPNTRTQKNASSSLQFLSPLSKYFNSQWSFAQCVIEPSGVPFTCSFGTSDPRGDVLKERIKRAIAKELNRRTADETVVGNSASSQGSSSGVSGNSSTLDAWPMDHGAFFPTAVATVGDGFVVKSCVGMESGVPIAASEPDVKASLRWSPPFVSPSTAIIIVTRDGAYYKFAFDTVKGGECVLERFHWLDRNSGEDSFGRSAGVSGRGEDALGIGDQAGDAGVGGVVFGLTVIQ